VAECRTVAIEIAPLCTVVIPMLIHRGNHSTQRHDSDSDCPAVSHRNTNNVGGDFNARITFVYLINPRL